MNSSGCTHMCEKCDKPCIVKAVKFIVVNDVRLPIVIGSPEPLDIACENCQESVI